MTRPVGSINKPKLMTWNGTKKDPATVLANIMSDETQELDTRMRAAIALMPYVHRKQPIAVEADIEERGAFLVRIIREIEPPADVRGAPGQAIGA